MEGGSAIRRVWDQGFRMKQLHGAENVADMTLGNPVAPPPRALLRALEELVALARRHRSKVEAHEICYPHMQNRASKRKTAENREFLLVAGS